MKNLIAAALAAFFVSACQTTPSEPVAVMECPERHVTTAQFLAVAEKGNATLVQKWLAKIFSGVEA